MKKLEKLFRIFSIILGLASVAFFVFDFVLLVRLKPKMTQFEIISQTEENLLLMVGIGLVVFLIFCTLSLFQLAKYLKTVEMISLISLLLVTSIILSLLFTFSDFALLNDIDKQYKHGLAQPEWSLVFPIMAFQFIAAIAFTYLHIFGFKYDESKRIAQDSNIFLIVQYVGIICGLMGLAFASLGFFFPRAWSLQIHSTVTTIIILFPYFIVVLYWIYIKFREKTRILYDEKQLHDISKSAILTLLISVFFMTMLFISNFKNLDGVVSILWFPLYLFMILLFFSLGNFYFFGKT